MLPTRHSRSHIKVAYLYCCEERLPFTSKPIRRAKDSSPLLDHHLPCLCNVTCYAARAVGRSAVRPGEMHQRRPGMPSAAIITQTRVGTSGQTGTLHWVTCSNPTLHAAKSINEFDHTPSRHRWQPTGRRLSSDGSLPSCFAGHGRCQHAAGWESLSPAAATPPARRPRPR